MHDFNFSIWLTRKKGINFITCQLSTSDGGRSTYWLEQRPTAMNTYFLDWPTTSDRCYRNQTCLTRFIEIRNWFFSLPFLFFAPLFRSPTRLNSVFLLLLMLVFRWTIQQYGIKTRIKNMCITEIHCCRALKRTQPARAYVSFFSAIFNSFQFIILPMSVMQNYFSLRYVVWSGARFFSQYFLLKFWFALNLACMCCHVSENSLPPVPCADVGSEQERREWDLDERIASESYQQK